MGDRRNSGDHESDAAKQMAMRDHGRPTLLLINPIQRLDRRRQRGWNGNRFVPPPALGYVAALTPPGWEVRIVDENAGDDAGVVAGACRPGGHHVVYADQYRAPTSWQPRTGGRACRW